jgi:hypothetical protein
MERPHKRGISPVSVAELLDTGSAAGRLVLNIMTAVSQWEREAIRERTQLPYGTRMPIAVSTNQAVAVEWLDATAHLGGVEGDAVPTKQVGNWFAQTVMNVLDNSLHQAA